MFDLSYKFDAAFTVIISVLMSMAACIGAAMPDLGTQNAQILSDTQMRFACIIGAFGGALLNVAIFPPRGSTNIRKFGLKFVASGVSGVMFAPMVCRWWGFHRDFDLVVGVSCGVAITAIGALKLLVPVWERLAVKYFDPSYERESREIDKTKM